jgi:hypothetical protein
MLMVFAFVLGAVSVPLCGGRYARAASHSFRHGSLLVAALMLQTLTVTVWPGMPRAAAAALHLTSYAGVALFLGCNRRSAGMWVVALGAGLNLVAILVNGGVMPARAGALRTAGRASAGGEFVNSAAVARPRLAWLGDVAAVPDAVPFANVFSIGDVLIVLGALVVLHEVCGSRLTRRGKTPRGAVVMARADAA